MNLAVITTEPESHSSSLAIGRRSCTSASRSSVSLYCWSSIIISSSSVSVGQLTVWQAADEDTKGCFSVWQVVRAENCCCCPEMYKVVISKKWTSKTTRVHVSACKQNNVATNNVIDNLVWPIFSLTTLSVFPFFCSKEGSSGVNLTINKRK